MSKKAFLSQDQVKSNILNLKKYMKESHLDGIYFSSNDIFLNEYAPLEDCHRYYVTNFTGSTAEVIVPREGKVLLFVDGRYFEQADLEVDLSLVEVVKVDQSVGLRNSLLKTIEEKKLKLLGVEGDRIDLNLLKSFEMVTRLTLVPNEKMQSILNYLKNDSNKLILEIPIELTGESTDSKLKRILKPNEAFFITALDSIAWLTNLRRYEIPNQSTFRSKALATYDRVYLLLEEMEGEIKNPAVEYYKGSFNKLNDFLTDIILVNRLVEETHLEIDKVYYSEAQINAYDFIELKKFFGENKLVNLRDGIVPFHACKNEVELEAFKSSFDKADKAIFNTINWIKSSLEKNQKVTELDFYHKCDEFYAKEGALDQSFNTISGFGPNSSIIHFSGPSENVVMTKNELALLDSGGYFEAGLATDTTRTFLTGGVASKKQKEIYTLVLKSLLHTLNAIFIENAMGSTIDGVARQPLFKYGYNYNHGTGHGVGINVHESGFRISPVSTVPLKVNHVGSIEPGIYIPGFGGVRLENIVIVRKHPAFSNMCYFESLTYVGFDHDLIDLALLNEEEKLWLDRYEAECEKRGRSFRKK